ncbi:MAG: hypothetical protein CL831_08940 [Crocinitomicaceae bacterium]|nr:hypothetical protein [Crocinitomicaceae bacterium]|tara:strand:- start:3066 stop:3857 length:792 start_codon:yes stop_codon:yes gene_type:complete
MSNHSALDVVASFGERPRSHLFRQILEQGYSIVDDFLSPEDCSTVINDVYRISGVYPYDVSSQQGFNGVYRSAFIFSNVLRDLLLNVNLHSIIHQFFPTNYQLHLNRVVINQAKQGASTVSWHRDLPHMHTFSDIPLSLSVLTFLTDSKSESQLLIKERSHRENFYSYASAEKISINARAGQSIVFDSNLVHMTPIPANYTTAYNLFMFTCPLLKPVVEYSSPAFFLEISKNTYKIARILEVLGYAYIRPRDDFEYMATKNIK